MKYFKKQKNSRNKKSISHPTFINRKSFTILLKITVALLVVWFLVKFSIITYKIIQLRTENPKMVSIIQYWVQKHQEKHEPYSYSFKVVPIEKISVNLKTAIIATEDPNFFSHHGFDLGQIKESFFVNIKQMKIARGASTITMQTARTLFLHPKKTFTRKAQEAIITVIMELVLSKKRIFELYLNYAELGDGLFGVESATRFYYHKNSSDLSISQSICLAASISAPGISNCAHPDLRLQRRVKIVYNKMKLLSLQTKKAILATQK